MGNAEGMATETAADRLAFARECGCVTCVAYVRAAAHFAEVVARREALLAEAARLESHG